MMSWRHVLVVLLVMLHQHQATSRLIKRAASELAAGEAQQLFVGKLTTPRCSLLVQTTHFG